VDLLLDAASLPAPFPRMLAAGPVMACGLAVSLLGGTLPPYLKKLQPPWAFLRDQNRIHRIIVTASSPVGERAVLAISSQRELNKTAKSVYNSGSGFQLARGRNGLADKAVITGMGAVSAVGLGSAAFCQELIRGRSGVVSYTPPGGGSPVPAAVVGDLPRVQNLGRSTQLALAAAEEALLDSGLSNGAVSGIYLGETLTSVESWGYLAGNFRQKNYQLTPGTLESTYECTASVVAKRLGFYGETSTFASGCTSGLVALGRAARDAALGVGPVLLAGGVDSNLFPLALGVLSQAQLLTACQDPQQAGRPFDRERDGEVTGEGCAVFVVENPEAAAKRGVVPYACISGFGTAGEGHHFKYNKPDGEAIVTAAEAALHKAGLKAEDIDLVMAHASGFMGSDAIEVKLLPPYSVSVQGCHL
jgi:3-oxoacyl-(acyl-carrier-protein) synthase